MRVISLLSRKGGSGKSTLAIHYAVEAFRSGADKVALIDMDPQGSCLSWARKREQTWPTVQPAVANGLVDQVETCRRSGVDVVVIDTTPDISRSAVEAVRVANLVVIPARPSILDLEAIGGSVDLVQRLGVPSVIVLNQVPATSTVTDEAREALAGYGVGVCSTPIVQRLVYSRALIVGSSAGELEPGGKAATEIAESWKWMIETARGQGWRSSDQVSAA